MLPPCVHCVVRPVVVNNVVKSAAVLPQVFTVLSAPRSVFTVAITDDTVVLVCTQLFTEALVAVRVIV